MADMSANHAEAEWWRTAVIYQIYPRSFADASGDGIGDLRGITSRLGALAELGVDAIWLSPFYTSPQVDAGYDVADFRAVDPIFGNFDDFDAMLARAHGLGLRVIVDIVPNHSSSAHEWFEEALKAAPGSPERARYIFRDGAGEDGSEPPNNWDSVFGGPAWTRVTEPDGTPDQWYLHLFDSAQPDLNWENEAVRAEFDDVLRFWLDRGVDGFRVDVAHGLIKAEGLPDFTPGAGADSMGGAGVETPFWGQDRVHDVWSRWRRVLDVYEGDRALVAEAWVYPLDRMALWVRPGEMQQAFNFAYLMTDWDAAALRAIIDESLAAFSAVGAPATWVLSNHDVVRHRTRLAVVGENPQGHGIGPRNADIVDHEVGGPRARAATLLMLGLPGSAYVYQGEELGLPEVIDIPDAARQDPTWHRTQGERYGRDGCRVPIPWEADAPAYGFSTEGNSWLPQPADWAPLARDTQAGDPESTLAMYREALRLRREHELGAASLEWIDGLSAGVLGARISDVEVYANVTGDPMPLPAGEVLLSSGPITDVIPADTTLWLRA